MKFIKKNWKKIVLIVTGAIFCSIVFVIIGLFLWMKSWKTVYSRTGEISLRYPSTGHQDNTKQVSVKDNFNVFFVTITEEKWQFPENKNYGEDFPTEIAPTATQSAYKEVQMYANNKFSIEKIKIDNHEMYLSKSDPIFFNEFGLYIPNNEYVYGVVGRILNSNGTRVNTNILRTIFGDIIINLIIHSIRFH